MYITRYKYLDKTKILSFVLIKWGMRASARLMRMYELQKHYKMRLRV